MTAIARRYRLESIYVFGSRAAEVVRGESLYTEDAYAESESRLYHLRRAGDLTPFCKQQWKELVGSDP
ncbi:MAG: hypothetical protein JW990_14660 [Thermoleophilia bacterium]|nr:hypothetical protein [Thermoleophilia bacterium]